jgi:hypothetical protein
MEFLVNNIGTIDRKTRALVGAGLALAELSGYLGPAEQIFQFATIGMALFLVITGLFGYCPTYNILGFSTCADEDEDQ